MKPYLAESDIEEAAIGWLLEIPGYQYQHGSEIKRPPNKAVLEDRFAAFLHRRYPHVPPQVLEEVRQEFLFNRGADLHHRNHHFHLKLSRGLSKSWKDEGGSPHFEHFYPLDYEIPEQNDFLLVNQFTIEGKNVRRPDLLLFVNGLPLVLFEFKNPFDQEATVETAFNQLQHYIQDIPQLFETNALSVISDGFTTLHGMYSSGLEWFAAWKSTDGREVVQGGFALETLVKGLLTPERLLPYIRHYIFHEPDRGQLIKKGAKYHQFFGIQYALQETKKSIRPLGDGRIGVVWHTTRSGKSITMAIYTGILRQLPELRNPTIVVQVDRFDLNKQLYEDFVAAKDLVGEVQLAQSTDELRRLLSGEGGGVVFSTIEKFRLKEGEGGRELEHPILSERENIIVIADECHRTQYGLVQGFANNLRRALPGASFIGFTGTPVDSREADTVAVFGEIIHTYDIRQATEDKAVVPIFYEPRLAKLHLGNPQLEEEAEEITGGLEEGDKNKILWAAMEDAAGSAARVEAIAKDILQHYRSRSESLEGKAMIVCMSRRNCVKLYDALTALPGCPEVAVIMTTNIAKDPAAWNPHVRTKEAMEGVKARFKDPDDPLKLVIVRDMWLTGFDNPAMHTLYVDKVMSGHNLIQAVNRVATVFKDKPSGLIVDYIGIGDKLRDATHKYTASGGKGAVTIDVEEAFQFAREVVNSLKQLIPAGFAYQQWPALGKGDKFKLVNIATNWIVAEEDRCQQFMKEEQRLSSLMPLIKNHESINEIGLDMIFFQHLGAAIRKAKFPLTNIRKKEGQIRELIHRSIESEEVVDVFQMAGIDRFDISILNDDFLATAKEQKSGNELKLELIRQIMNEEIKLRSYKNLAKSRKLKEEVERIIHDYHNHFFDSLIALQKLRDVAKQLQDQEQRLQQLGITEEEEAFYEILSRHPNALQDFGLIKELVKEITALIKQKAAQPDWYKKVDTKAQIILSVKKVLLRKGVRAELQEILDEIMEQAEARYKEWSVKGVA
ncbi:type I restriction endonuclease subunit R [Cesiribacter andamanensis]|uniref:Type I restriction enzyme endonuclease subunit n=1 Tax=Cesiribacter andamanensis AMV16 TaxID=1279009 RepID=M7N3S8_9BACT|nr:type I restriction endonuclease subunit R [Cesiribacter andamanensis]EMR01866.1 Type-1 restriction enzyme R protein [Cesiribacter andamanensis AMV16]